jgi:hypothetical protein
VARQSAAARESRNGQSLFHRDPARRDELTGTLRGRFGKWLESLRKSVTNSPAGFQPEDATMLD